ncbi:MAG: hypothetical protein V4619_07500 [Bacteroidota bacterium]
MQLRVVNKEGMVLDLPGDTVITVERNNPLFNDPDTFFQDKVFQFMAPFNPNNDLFLKMGRLIETSNEYYLITDIKFYVVGMQMFDCNLRFASRSRGYEVYLEPNLYVIKSLIEKIRLPDIPTEDADYSITTVADMEARMLDTCRNPDKYGYIYFPVENPKWFTDGYSVSTPYDYVNNFDFTPGTFYFKIKKPGVNEFAVSPYFKLSYILKQIAGYLGLTPTGSFFTDPETKNICIYTRYAENNFSVMPCMLYMPNILLPDFLKIIRMRLHLAMDIDLVRGEFEVKTFKSIAAETIIEDLSPFITARAEHEVPDQEGFTVTLLADDQDPLYEKLDEDDTAFYPPDFTLYAGSGETPEEIECGTLKERVWIGPAGVAHVRTEQTVFNRGIHTGGAPQDLKREDENDPTTFNNWPLRLIDYKGFLPVAGGYYPVSRSFNLNQDDIDYYRFKTSCKRVTVNAEIPPAVLSNFKSTKLYGHKDTGINFTRYIPEQIAYDAKSGTELVGTKITALTTYNQVRTSVIIKPFTDPLAESVNSYPFAHFKAYYDPELHGIQEVDVQAHGMLGDIYAMSPITKPTNLKGAGGLISVMYVNLINPAPGYLVPIQLTVTSGVPKYVLHRGNKYHFEKTGHYYTVTIEMWQEFIYIQDCYIIFY